MPQKTPHTRARIQNLVLVNKKCDRIHENQLDSFEPEPADISEEFEATGSGIDSDYEDLDSDIFDEPNDITEESELTKFSFFLQEAQRIALEVEKTHKKWNPYTGKSRSTLYHHKRSRRELSTKGFLPLDEFIRRKSTHKDGKLLTIAVPLESEESSDDSLVPSPDNDRRTGEINDGTEAEHSCTSMTKIPHIPSHTLRQESEESSSDDNEDQHPARNPTALKQLEYTSQETSDTAVTLLDDLRHGLALVDLERSSFTSQNTLELLCDLPRLRKACNQLTMKAKDKKLDIFFQACLLAMAGVLDIYLAPDLKYTWKEASYIVSKAQGHGTHCVRCIRKWLLKFLWTEELPVHNLA
ncbi:hypothetical protein BC826DRAFT_974179 [Russula brevipes]|nr:hypothetical protein BC826DRAFT_974179 [Russula brevipes]